MYDLARAYYVTHGDLDVPSNFVTPEGAKLGAWLAYQRTKRGRESWRRRRSPASKRSGWSGKSFDVSTSSVADATASPRGEAQKGAHQSLPLEGKVASGVSRKPDDG